MRGQRPQGRDLFVLVGRGCRSLNGSTQGLSARAQNWGLFLPPNSTGHCKSPGATVCMCSPPPQYLH